MNMGEKRDQIWKSDKCFTCSSLEGHHFHWHFLESVIYIDISS